MGFVLLLVAHFIGDFILQTAAIAQKKTQSIRFFAIHCLIYAGIMLIALFNFASLNLTAVGAYVMIVGTHAVVDLLRIKILKRSEKGLNHKKTDLIVFIADQVVHLVIIFAAACLITESWMIWNDKVYHGLVYLLLYLICLSPTAILIKKVFVFFSFQTDTHSDSADKCITDKNDDDKRKDELISNGYLIGVLERIILLTLGLNGQMAAFGFVLAAKSLARFKQLEDKDFAEKYLVGTLLSSAVSLFCIMLGNAVLF
ncbi:DUF3307 domain-containing protein [Dehalobacter sp. DCM]|uniref:DUF3307 domain-containing protein n=1 Tax=Dehalobacter sp. DCM TaxID=2907827 RepID=UPI0030817B16|nr:DUF3307 domain-containing protein [Dehalobacter sp. DCM]